ncbi:NADPH-dependent FMN reductase [Saxibacter everestensis]|uniref:NADPH-dependent FMN reductase n=1 Tax=Saxibacter everestensis TaxID=2909229 RepID=A0ABY8QQK8_9MICO|nr:NADPH-dependent FMN reductase [Brevibacteriaceae bacterium ZFBP1038]
MAKIVTLSGSPSNPSRTDALLAYVTRLLAGQGHDVQAISVRDLPATPLLAADVSDPEIRHAIQALTDADGVVIGSPVYKATYSGLLKSFIDLLPMTALSGKAVLPLMTGGSTAHVLALDFGLKPLLSILEATSISAGRFVRSADITSYPDGGVVLETSAAQAVLETTTSFLAELRLRAPFDVDAADRDASARVSAPELAAPRPGSIAPSARPEPPSARPEPPAPRARHTRVPAEDLEVRKVAPDDPLLVPLRSELAVEYSSRYVFAPGTALEGLHQEEEENRPDTFVLLLHDGQPVAGGAIRPFETGTAEVKRVWTATNYRRQGLARRVMAELEAAAREYGYRRLFLTTGNRQPEARELYLRAGYTPLFDPNEDLNQLKKLAFSRELYPAIAGAERDQTNDHNQADELRQEAS